MNIFIYMHPGPRSNRHDTDRFHFCDLEITSSKSSKVKFFMDSESPISTSQECFIVTIMVISHRQDIGDFHICDLQMTP